MERQFSKPEVKKEKEPWARRIGRSIKTSVADFFGVGEDMPIESQKWQNRRIRHATKKYGKLKEDCVRRAGEDDVDSLQMRYIQDPLHRGSRRATPLSSTSTYHTRGSRLLQQKKHRKESVLRMTLKGLSGRKKSKPKVDLHSRSYAPASLAGEGVDLDDHSLGLGPGYTAYQEEENFSLVDDVFFDDPLTPYSSMKRLDEHKGIQQAGLPSGMDVGWRSGRPPHQGLPDTPSVAYDVPDGIGLGRIANKVVDKALEKTERRRVGMGFVGRLFNRSFRSDRINSEVKEQLEEIDDHRPYFTYWVTFVQVVVFIVSVSIYGIAPLGISETRVTAMVTKPNLVTEQVAHIELDNFWIGPRQADLIHLGAKYSPCMRRDANIIKAIEADLAVEKESACCILTDVCYQTTQANCPDKFGTFEKWPTADNNRTSGSVCGQDPKYCKTPASAGLFTWEDNIHKWPLCTDTNRPNGTSRRDRHMTCEITGHPCCFGIQGECFVTTREHCDHIRGYYHDDAYLCSQVSCLSQICGMIPFSNSNKPDQFYRLWTSLFLHVGLVHVVITIAFQFLIMRDVEKLAGPIRVAIIYIGGGIAGNLASAIFLPYQVEVGPAGSQFAILSCLVVEVIQSWQMLKRPVISLFKILGIILILFILGLLPWIDNYAHLCGFVFGFLLAFAMLPYVSFGTFDRRRKIISIIVTLTAALGMFIILVILFYVLPIYECSGCQYFNCVPFTNDFCKNMEIAIRRDASYNKLWVNTDL
ncbi:inactive rhomboid protein 1-like [Liolophura sinensis]|uniref:inactive rhomboid protein 1-like n=1 Tax=Liolophura sinensis TaxID=3198878 RepID=UPI0031597CC1